MDQSGGQSEHDPRGRRGWGGHVQRGQSWSTLNNQPTAQFYRVNADNRFPYWVYGGQQDNSSVAVKSRDMDGSIGPADFRPSAGCESAYLAFDPDNPRYQYGGCYLGQITERDEATGLSRNVQILPGMPASVQPRDMPYRFNWNAPILVSPHDPKVLYHASNHLLRSRDRGNSWEVMSPDLTKGRGPLSGRRRWTHHERGRRRRDLWGRSSQSVHPRWKRTSSGTGSDDGLVHVTRGRWRHLEQRDAARSSRGVGRQHHRSLSPPGRRRLRGLHRLQVQRFHSVRVSHLRLRRNPGPKSPTVFRRTIGFE